MKIILSVTPEEGILRGECNLHGNEIISTKFYLNRDFIIDEFIIDGIPYEASKYQETIIQENSFNYKVHRYTLPKHNGEITIKYTGRLDGNSGSCPYVKETISPDYTLLRWESYCYPLFFDEDKISLSQYVKRTGRQDDIIIKTPSNYQVLSSEIQASSNLSDMLHIHHFKGNANNFSIAVANFNHLNLTCGQFYLLNNSIDQKQLEYFMKRTHEIMNETFGEREIKSDIKYIEIPEKHGSYVQDQTVFLDRTVLQNVKYLNHIVHEFIHLGWNPKVDRRIQKCRFFDEALTNYFTLRVMEELVSKEDYDMLFNAYITTYQECIKDMNQDIPIVEFGKYGYGDLSYSIGSLALYELESILGREAFDYSMTIFLKAYQNKETDFDAFRDCFMKESTIDLRNFFESWIYGSKGFVKYQSFTISQ